MDKGNSFDGQMIEDFIDDKIFGMWVLMYEMREFYFFLLKCWNYCELIVLNKDVRCYVQGSVDVEIFVEIVMNWVV